jgi:hypothetical protein
MTTEHPVLAGIRDSVRANGSHTCHWGNLRRDVFPGKAAWIELRAWCAENDLECQLSFGEASKHAEVHFIRAIKLPAAAAPDTTGAAASPA